MASTYTNSNALNKQSVGDNVNTWGLVVNNNFDLLDQAIDGVASIPLTGATASLTIDEGQLSNGRAAVLVFTGGLSAPCTVSLPPTTGNLTKVYWAVNNSGQNVVLQQLPQSGTAGTTVTVSNASSEPVYTDGQGNVISLGASVTSAPGNFEVHGNLTVDGNISAVGLTLSGDASVRNLTATNNVHAQNLTIDGDAHFTGNTFADQSVCTTLEFNYIVCLAAFTNTVTIGSGAGTGGTVNKAGASDSCGQIIFTTGTSPASTAGQPLVTVTIANPTTALNVIFSPMNPAMAASGIYLEHDETSGDTVTSFTLYSGSAALQPNTAYAFSYVAIK